MSECIQDTEMSQATWYQGQYMLFSHNLKGKVNSTWDGSAEINSSFMMVNFYPSDIQMKLQV